MNARLIAITAAALFVATAVVAQEAPTKTKKPSSIEMLTAVCSSKAVKSEKLTKACETSAKLAGLDLEGVTVKAPTAEVKVLFANLAFFK